MGARIEREKRVVEFMIKKYCVDQHNTEQLCLECNDLLEYSLKHLVKCPFAENKPVCSKCTIHCYSKNYKKLIQQVMRYSGPIMIYEYPKDTILYFFDKLRYRSNSDQIN
jgi:Nitrous oxide-stimulated promoter